MDQSIHKSKDSKYDTSRDNLSLVQSVEDDSWSSINMFESKKVELTSSASINDLKYGRPHQRSNQLKSKHQVKNKNK